MHVALVGTYPPKRCGIATFTADVEAALRQNGTRVTVVPVLGKGEGSSSPLAIRRDDRRSYVDAARLINSLDVDVVVIQHEFGIFGGEAGQYVLALADHLDMPFAATLHTVLPTYNDVEASVLEKLCARAALLTVMTESARSLVVQQELAPAGTVVVIPHGAPAELFDTSDSPDVREQFGIRPDAPVITTFGLLSEGKGIELVIRSMAMLGDRYSDLHYIVAGATHPEVVKHSGERYRRSLEALARKRGLQARVHFVDRFMELDELADVLGITSVVCTPYKGEHQSVSGVLTFALAAGCPVVSTPFRYAEELLADGAGRIVNREDLCGFARAIASLVDGPMAAHARDAARTASSAMQWPAVGAQLQLVLGRLLIESDDTRMFRHAQTTSRAS